MVLMKKFLVASLLILSACTNSNPATESGLPTIVTGAFPLAWLSNQLAAGCATVSDLTPSGGDVHDLELTPSQTAEIIDADLVVTVSGFQPAFDDAAATTTAPVIDVITVINPINGHSHSHEDDAHSEDEHGHSEESTGLDVIDPHFWLDPNRMILAAELIAENIAMLSDECNQLATAQIENLRRDLVELDLDFKSGLAQCESNTLVVSHEAFGYLGDAYNLKQIAVAGLDPESEPSAARINEIINLAKKEKVAAVFTERSANPAVAEILADELKVGVLPLDPIELKPASLDYLTVMATNLSNLREGLVCN